MVRKFTSLVALIVMAVPSISQASTLAVDPLPGGNATVRYVRGTPTLQIDDANATVDVTPTALDHGRLTFAVAAFNKSTTPFNFGVESVQAANGANVLHVWTKDELVKQAKNRATWAMIGMAVAAGLAAGATAATAGRESYSGSFYGGGHFYHYSGTYYNGTEAALATGAVAAGGAYAIDRIQTGLDQLTAGLNNQILQTTTVDPGAGYGGIVVLDKLKAKDALAQSVSLNVRLNGHDYVFNFKPTKK